MYLLWLFKSLDVTEPTVVASEDFQEEVAYMFFVASKKIGDGLDPVDCDINPSHMRDFNDCRAKFSWYGNLERFPVVEMIEADEEPGLDPLPVTASNPEIITHFMKQKREANDEIHDYVITTITESYVPRRGSDIACTMVSGQALRSGLGPEYRRPGLKISLSRKDVKRLGLAGSFIAKERNISNNLCGNFIIPVGEAITSAFERRLPKPPVKVFPNRGESPSLLYDRISNASWNQIDIFFDDILDAVTYTLFFLIIALVDGAYAGAHLGALSVMFPSPTERLM
jgi:hypothetical protein